MLKTLIEIRHVHRVLDDRIMLDSYIILHPSWND